MHIFTMKVGGEKLIKLFALYGLRLARSTAVRNADMQRDNFIKPSYSSLIFGLKTLPVSF